MNSTFTNINKNWLLIALGFLISIAILGLLMRLSLFSGYTFIEYPNLLQTHSHVAFVGWANLALIAGLVGIYTDNKSKYIDQYKYVVIGLILITLGMMIGFPMQGYGLVAISSLVIYLLIMYGFTFYFLKDIKKLKRTIDIKFIQWGLIYFIISSIGPWSLGPLIALGFKQTDIYYLGIYFYLHFTYNGFFTFIIFGLFFKYLNIKKIVYNKDYASKFFVYLNIACIPSYLLSTLWVEPSYIFYVVGIISGVLQLVALYYLVMILKGIKYTFIDNRVVKMILLISILSFSVKIIAQLFSGMPLIANVIFIYKQYTVIGYLHLVLLGFVSSFLLGYFSLIDGYNAKSRLNRFGVLLFVFGFLGSELVLLLAFLTSYNGVLFANYYPIIFLVSSFMLLGILIFFIGQFLTKRLVKS